MKRCSFCNKEIEEKAIQCKHCGASLVKTCPYCGKEILAVAKKCKWCKRLIKNEDSNISVKILIIIFMGIILLLFLFFIISFALTPPRNALEEVNNIERTNNPLQEKEKTKEAANLKNTVIKGKELNIKDALFNENLRKFHNYVITEFKVEQGILIISFAGSTTIHDKPFKSPLNDLSNTVADDGDGGYIIMIKNLKNKESEILYLHTAYLTKKEINEILNILQPKEISIFTMLKNMFKESVKS